MKLNLNILNSVLEAMNFNIDDSAADIKLGKLTSMDKSSEIFRKSLVDIKAEQISKIIENMLAIMNVFTDKDKYTHKFLEILILDLDELLYLVKVENLPYTLQLKIKTTLDLAYAFNAELENECGKLPAIKVEDITYYNTFYKVSTKEELKKIIESIYASGEYEKDLNFLDVSNISDMSHLFAHCPKFNCNISKWDVSNVISMDKMFTGAESFNLDISNWDVSKVVSMNSMFNNAKKFNLPIGKWNVRNVKDMSYMFCGANAFNLTIRDWDVSHVENMEAMFDQALSFNQPIGDWDTSKVVNMDYMFFGTINFNLDISNWNVEKADAYEMDVFDSGCHIENKYKPAFKQLKNL